MNPYHFITPAGLIFAAALILATLAGFVLIPEAVELPVHWNLFGTVDATAPRNMALLWPPGTAALIWGAFYAVLRFSPPNQAQASRHLLSAALAAMTGLFGAIQVAIVMIGLGMEVDVIRVICLGMAVLVIVLGNAMPKSRPNAFAGLRIPTTLGDPANWQATHHLLGRLMMGAGVLLGLAVLVIATPELLLGAVLIAVLLPLVIAIVFSIRLARR